MMPLTPTRRSPLRLLQVLCLLLLGGLSSSSLADWHPQDGPHVDVRIRIEPERVLIRLEMNLVFMDHILDFPRETPDRISELEFEALPDLLDEFFSRQHPVSIDGVRVLPTMEQLQINDPDLTLLPLFPVSGEQGLRKIRFDLVYPAKQAPTRVDFEWSSFPPDILLDAEDPPSLKIAADLESNRIRTPLVFTEEEPGYTWHAGGDSIEERMLAVPTTPEPEVVAIPMASLILLLLGGVALVMGLLAMARSQRSQPLVIAVVVDGILFAVAATLYFTQIGMFELKSEPPLPESDQAREIFTPLHANIYRAFDYVDESDIYDALAQSADGPFLDTLYRTIFRGLVMEEEGGAVARVARVTPLEIEVEDIGIGEDGRVAFTVNCHWQVDGVVSHWGHTHARSNQYRARWGVAMTPEGWRLTGARILAQDRVDAVEDDPDHDEEFEIGDDFEL
ncbi:MAG: hypothetical protein MK085_10855 [Phycisphaerales bacterium]|nr:hypothetical protein [Phycisphaerales bacterium]